MGCMSSSPPSAAPAQQAAPELSKSHKIKQPALGIIRLDYDYPATPGDIDHPDTFGYPVFYRAVPGFTFAMCQSGKMTPEVEKHFCAAIKFLEEKKVRAITGDCGFMMYFQELARKYTHLPVFLSSLAILPAVTCAYGSHEKIAIFTANGKSLEPMHDLIKDECGVETHEDRYIIVNCSTVPGFEAVELGQKVDITKVGKGMVEKARQVVSENPALRAFMFECTELGPYSDSVRLETGLPVFDATTACNFFMMSVQDDERFGINDWQKDWDGKQHEYKFGEAEGIKAKKGTNTDDEGWPAERKTGASELNQSLDAALV